MTRASPALLAAAAVIAAVAWGLRSGHHDREPGRDAVVVVSEPAAIAPPKAVPTPGSEPSVAAPAPPVELAAPQVPDAPADYPYWDQADAGVWATPAEFSDQD